MWEYLIVALIVGWAVYFVWKTFFRKRGCSCGSGTCDSGSKGKDAPCCGGSATIKPMAKDAGQDEDR
ncbi:hypothetical protein [Oceanidesulfovibrio marinus]|uniref:Virus attachment protein p12 family protein n=1 Tax=Oceanidesulfovibrio marinus TaxID=370038 RepID=A0ABX6NMR6_9BACT|nr:hypothetical protein [Oceanidesulfovibrio marinus]QJT10975.1 hypothetical protein E8L03_19570 [Oceanidesulfovibrio marinus]